jgi:hypothetical protein
MFLCEGAAMLKEVTVVANISFLGPGHHSSLQLFGWERGGGGRQSH